MDSVDRQNKIIGTLVPLSSLSSIKSKKENQGTFETGIVFLDWLQKTGQNAWQLLPLHLTQLEKGSSVKRVPSPYKGYGVGLDPKYLSKVSKVSKVSKALDTRGTEAASRVRLLDRGGIRDTLDTFIRQNKDWIEDYALFCALTKHFGTDDWCTWEKGIRNREGKDLEKWRVKLHTEIDSEITLQYKLHNSYGVLRKKAREMGILLIGDLPFYLSINSPLVWAYQEAFQIPKSGKLRFVSGIPYYNTSHFGRQIWNHPLYKWDMGHYKKVLEVWEIRLGYLSNLFEYVRIDSAKAFFEYGVMDLLNEKNDKFVEGPGVKALKSLSKISKMYNLAIYAEDAGSNLTGLREAMKKLDIPGIKIFRFAYNEKLDKLIKNYSDIDLYPTNCVAYTTTHDTESLVSNLNLLTNDQKRILSEATGVRFYGNDLDFAKNLRNRVIESKAKIVIIPIQDWLLTTDRINIPGTERDIDDLNWRYKLKTPIEKLPVKF